MKYASYVIWNNDTMEKESEDSHGYNKLKYLYETGLHKIFDAREIEQEKTKPYFKQEYCRFYDFDTRNLFTATTLDTIEHLAQIDASYDTIHYNIHKSLGIDIGYGSSKTEFTITENVDGHIRVIHSQAFSRPLSEEMINDAVNLIFHFKLNGNSNQVLTQGIRIVSLSKEICIHTVRQ